MATVAAPLPLRATGCCAGAAPCWLSSSDGARFPGRPVQRGLVAGACRRRDSAGFRVEALFGGGGVGPKEPMVPPYNVLITGSTKGIGYALAKKFLKAGDNVVICSRSVYPLQLKG